MANITGTGNNDILPGTALDDFINGLGGNDTITANDGNDIIIGGLGADTIFSGNGDDEIWGGGTEWAAGEVIDGGAGNNKLSTWGGDISVVTITNVQTLGTHLNKLSLKSSQLTAFSALIAYDGPLMLQATEAGTYSLQGKSVTGVFSITGSSGNDYLAGNSAAQTLAGGDGNDRLQGLGGADILLGGNGDDEFLTGFTESPAGETIDGGAGFNSISSWNVDLSNATVSNVQKLNAALDRVTLTAVQLAGFTTLSTGSAQIDLIAAGAGTYSLQGKSVTGKFNLIGSAGNDYLAGNSAAQTLSGATGNDVLQGAGGADVMLGGDGDDEFLTGFNESVNETIDGGTGNNTLSSWNADLSTTTISNIQTLVTNLNTVRLTDQQLNGFSRIINYGSNPVSIQAAVAGTYDFAFKSLLGSFSFTGSTGSDTLRGGLGVDTLQGGDGDDTISTNRVSSVEQLFGEAGNDTFVVEGYLATPLAGTTIDGGSGFNTITGEYLRLNDFMITNIQHLDYRGNAILTAEQIEQISTFSGSGYLQGASAGIYDLSGKIVVGDALGSFIGSNGDDVIIGHSSTHLIQGYDGSDTIYGGDGENFILGGRGIDTLYGGGGFDNLVGEIAFGNDGDDYLNSEDGPGHDNYFDGGTGNDIFFGEGGVDTLIGGTGNDTYYILDGNTSITDVDGTSGNTDVVAFGGGVDHDEIWFSRSGNDLTAAVIGTDDQVVIVDWYLGSDHHVEQFSTHGLTLLDSQVQNLVNAMAAFAVPTTTTLPPDYRAVLDPIIAANWT